MSAVLNDKEFVSCHFIKGVDQNLIPPKRYVFTAEDNVTMSEMWRHSNNTCCGYVDFICDKCGDSSHVCDCAREAFIQEITKADIILFQKKGKNDRIIKLYEELDEIKCRQTRLEQEIQEIQGDVRIM